MSETETIGIDNGKVICVMTRGQIAIWLAKNSNAAMLLQEEDFDHIVDCLEHIREWYNGNRPLGSFLTAVLRNDFCSACCIADDVNAKVLPAYALFLYNCLPGDWRERAKETL